VPLLLAVLFGLGVQATMFGPLKYGILPDHLADDELVAGNGLVEASTFLAILAGTIAGSALVLLPGGTAIVSAAGLAVSALGLVAALGIPRAPAADASLRIGWNIFRETGLVMRQASGNRPVWLSILALSWFWAMGGTLLTEFPAVVRDALGADGHVVSLLLGVFSVGVGVGSLLCARLLHGEISARHVPFAALGLTLFMLDFGATTQAAGGAHLVSVDAVLASPIGWRILGDLFLLAACGGLYSVPLFAILQEFSAPSHRARMVAANNVANALLMVAAAAMVAGLAAADIPSPRVLEGAAVANFLVALVIARVLLRIAQSRPPGAKLEVPSG
jgi:acyl-[acyl-carrier-protein]-phospholipid O-acyltransferase/long-chain-fatty-acid--[acyl-carrier-protein] ligase